MIRKILVVSAVLVALATSFIAGSMSVEDPIPEEISDAALLEVLDELMENHYKQPTREELLEGAIDGMIESLNDPFTTYFDYEEAQYYQQGFGETYVGIGVNVRYSDGYLVVDSVKEDGPADDAGIRVNDLIVEVEGMSVFELPFYEIVGLIIGDEGTEVSLGIVRTGIDEVIYLTMTRSTITSATIISNSFDVGAKKIGYIKVTTFGDETAFLFMTVLSELEGLGIDGLIVDLRDNGGGHLSTVYNMLNLFLVDNDEPIFSTEYYRDGDIVTSDYFSDRPEAREYDIVTLVNENSASASELFASAMQEHGGYAVIGQSTFGKGTMQTDVSVSATIGDELHITIGKWFTSDGNWVHFDGGTDGVEPDLTVELTAVEKAYKVFLIGDEEYIYHNSVDPRVANIQIILNIMGYDVRDDGYFDFFTKLAIQDIQAAHGLPTIGNIDSDTLIFINEALDDYLDETSNDTQLQASIEYLLDD